MLEVYREPQRRQPPVLRDSTLSDGLAQFNPLTTTVGHLDHTDCDAADHHLTASRVAGHLLRHSSQHGK